MQQWLGIVASKNITTSSQHTQYCRNNLWQEKAHRSTKMVTNNPVFFLIILNISV
jgi:hypothetical protein